jgi:protease-4
MDSSSPVILQLNIHGIIGTDQLNQSTVAQQLVESREGLLKNDRVKAILLHINTPGGTVSDADGIYRLLKNYRTNYQVPIYAYVDGLCASGGMYIASAADKIYATESSLIGSVGVLSPSLFNFHGLIEKLGVQSMTLSAGKGKDALDPWRPWRDGEQDQLQGIIHSYYQQFVDIVATGRPTIDREKLIGEYGAGIFTAAKAAEQGFVDNAAASRSQVLNELAADIDIVDDQYQVVQLESKNWLKELFTARLNAFQPQTIVHQVDMGDGLPTKLRGQFLYLYHPGS